MSASRPTWDETWMEVARVVALRSLCDRDKVGAVVVDESNRIVDTGYNGPPSGMTRIVQLSAHGPGMAEEDPEADCSRWCQRWKLANSRLGGVSLEHAMDPDYHDCPSLHAEANALMFSDRRHREGGTIYVTSPVCMGCAKLIANSGLKRVVIEAPATTTQRVRASQRRSDEGVAFMHQCGLEVVSVQQLGIAYYEELT